jgi:hypothetical protein
LNPAGKNATLRNCAAISLQRASVMQPILPRSCDMSFSIISLFAAS